MSVFWYQVYQARLWERLLNREAVPRDLKCILEAKPGKLDLKSLDADSIGVGMMQNLVFCLSVYPLAHSSIWRL